MKIGDKVDILYIDRLDKKEIENLKKTNFTCTVEDLDIITGKIFGVYVKELPGRLFSIVDVKLIK